MSSEQWKHMICLDVIELVRNIILKIIYLSFKLLMIIKLTPIKSLFYIKVLLLLEHLFLLNGCQNILKNQQLHLLFLPLLESSISIPSHFREILNKSNLIKEMNNLLENQEEKMFRITILTVNLNQKKIHLHY